MTVEMSEERVGKKSLKGWVEIKFDEEILRFPHVQAYLFNSKCKVYGHLMVHKVYESFIAHFP